MILAKLDHPNITKLLEFFPDGDNYAIVMEYVEGIELKKLLLQQKGVIPFKQAYKIALQSLDAFQYAHEHGILHRDIKPANIMIDKTGNVKIMDFGIAKMGTTASHDTAASMLSVHYTPPARFDKSREIDQRSDIYSLGLVFYEIFAGRRAFPHETSQIMFSHLNEIPEPPSKHSPNLPPQISKAICKALEKDPEDRFLDFKAFKQAILVDPAAIPDAADPRPRSHHGRCHHRCRRR
jgi:serine/threonine-protein kinase